MRFLKWTAISLLILAGLLALSLGILVYTDAGNDFIAARTQELINKKIPGHAKIAELRHVEGYRFRAKKVEFYPPDRKQPVLDLDGVHITLDPASITKGELIAPHASVQSGTVRLQLAASERTTLEETFDAPNDPSAKPGSSNPFGVHFRKIEVNDTRFLVDLNNFKFRARKLRGSIELERDPKAAGVVLTINELDGQHTHPKLIGIQFALRDLSGKIRGGQDQVVTLEGSGHSENNDVPFRLRYWSKPKRVVFDVNRDNTSPAFDIATTIGDMFVVPDFVELNFPDADS